MTQIKDAEPGRRGREVSAPAHETPDPGREVRGPMIAETLALCVHRSSVIMRDHAIGYLGA